MKKIFFLFILVSVSFSVLATQKVGGSDSTQQYMLIVRYKANMKMPDAEALKLNGQHWGEYLGKLGQSGKFISGYRLGTGGALIAGKSGVIIDGVYDSKNDVIGSVLIIKAVNMQDAKDIADKCPVFDFGGSVEIRPLINTVN